MNHDIYLDKVKNIIAELLKIDVVNIKEDTRFLEDLKMDSLHLVRLTMSIEYSFNIKQFPVDDYFTVKTVGQAVEQIEKALENQSLKTENLDPSAIDYDSPII
jgi:acyl carrier protein